MFTKKSKKYFFQFALVVVAFHGNALFAQDVEEVVVEAQQSENAVLDDMASVSAIDGEKLADAGIENVEDVAAYVPNLVLSETDTGTNIVIRGIGAGVNQGFDQSVGLYVDGVPLPRGQMARAPFLDLAGVQVLRGPQYVRDGNYSIAGSVHMITSGASDEFELGLDFNHIPSQKDQTLLLTTSLPFARWGGLRVAVQKQSGDGYIENVAQSQDGPQRDSLLFRGVLTLEPQDNLSVKLKYEKGSFDTVGRQIEIIESQPTPDYRLFPTARGGDPSNPIREARTSQTGRALELEYRSPTDVLLMAQRTLYDAAAEGEVIVIRDADGNISDVDNHPVWAGISYLEHLRNLYTGEGEIVGIRRGPTDPLVPVLPQDADGNFISFEPPPGILDDSVDFKRAADADEFGKNDTTNVSLNTELHLGEHTLELVASYVEYEFDERIDTDFTPVPIIETEQTEFYDQEFYRLEYSSPKESFMELSAGLSYLKSNLTFLEEVLIQTDAAQNQAEAELRFIELDETNINSARRRANITFDPEYPATTVLGRASEFANLGFVIFKPDRIFEQEAETRAAFFETKFNFSDRFRAILGARYTHSDKTAERDFAFLLRDDTPFVLPDDAGLVLNRQNFRSLIGLQAIFNFGQHSDRTLGVNPLYETGSDKGDRREEAFLPSLNLEWDATADLSLRAAVRMANKLGGFDARSNSSAFIDSSNVLSTGTFEFEDEEATTYELGARWYLPQGFGEITATAFYTDFDNLQVSAQDRGVGFNVRNAGAARTTGIEIEGLLLLTERFNVNYSFAWIDFEFTDYKLASCHLGRLPDYTGGGTAQVGNAGLDEDAIYRIRYGDGLVQSNVDDTGFGRLGTEAANAGLALDQQGFTSYDFLQIQLPRTCDFGGQTNQYVADWQGTFSFNYESEPTPFGIVRSTLDVLYNSGYETTVTQDPDVAQGEYFQFNGRLGLKSQDDVWELALTGENLTNEKIVLFANELPIATRIQASKSHYGFVRSPRAIGFNFRYSFF